jgi:hypothetical protein
MTMNSYLLVQAAATVAVTTPPGLTLGEWLAIISCGLVLAGVVYRSGVAAQKAAGVEKLVGEVLGGLSGKMDTLLAESQRDRVEDARWKADFGGRVARLEDEAPVHVHSRASDAR